VLRQRQVIFYQPAIAADPPNGIVATPALRAFGAAGTNDLAGKSGWYLDLVNPPYGTTEQVGERMVFDPIMVGGTVLVEASQAPSDDPCESGGGGYVNAISAFTGGAVTTPFFDANGDGSITTADVVTVAPGVTSSVGSIDPGVGMPSTPSNVGPFLLVGGSKGGLGKVPIPSNRTTGRISWREILRD
jgi:type IV pilus assembly protein PilY1